MADIAVIGPGAIGATVAAGLAQISSHALTVCVRSPVVTLTIETEHGQQVANPRVLTSPEQGTPSDWILVATKAYDAASAAGWFPRLMGPGTRVAILQNGVEHADRFASFIPRDRIVPVVVDIPVERVAPGHFRQRRSGYMKVANDRNGADFTGLFAGGGMDVSTTDDFRSAMWRKLAVNCAGAVSALVLKPAVIAHDPQIAAIMKDLVRECVAVGRAEGAVLEEGLEDTVVASYRNGPRDAVNSLHADRAAGRRIEIDARNGAIVRIGRRHGIDTPVNRMIVAMLEVAAAE
jgi:2-dehydropantoate 2-reductase